MKLNGCAKAVFCCLLGFELLVAHLTVHAAQEVAQSFTLDGKLYSDPAGATPLIDASIQLKIQILNQAETCILYEETQTISTAASVGLFSVEVGSATGAGKRSVGDSATNMQTVFSNTTTNVPGKLVSTGLACTYNPAPGDRRFVRLQITPSVDSVTRTIVPNMILDSVPMAVVAERAESVRGLTPTDLVQVNATTASLSQVNIENIFSNINYPKLNALVNGTSTQYIVSAPGTPVGFNSQRITNLANPTGAQDAATKIYVDSNVGGKSADVTGVGPGFGSGKTLVWDQALNKWVAQAAPFVSGIVAGNGLLGGTITTNGTLSVDVGTTGNKIVQLVGGKVPAVDGSLLTNLQYPVLSVNGRIGVVALVPSDIAGLGTAATKDYGTAAGNLVELAGNSRLPALDGYALTNLNATYLQSRRISSVAPTNGQILTWNATQWEPQAAPVSGITALTGDVTATGPGSAAATISANAVTSGKINSSGNVISRLLITDATTGATVTYATCLQGEVMKYDTTTGWGCAVDAGASGVVTMIAAGTGLVPGTITSVGTLAVDVGVTANKILRLDSNAQIPAVDGALVTNVNALRLQGRHVASAAPAINQVLTWNGTRWESMNPQASASSFVNGGNSFLGNANIGLTDGYNLNVVTNSLVRMTVTSAGDVGIGTTAPSATLDLSPASGDAVLTLRADVTDSVSGDGAFINFRSDGTQVNGYVGLNSGTIGQSTFNRTVAGAKSEGLTLDARTSTGIGHIQLATEDTVRMTVTPTGSIGIGTNAPLAVLDVVGTGTGQSGMIVPRDTLALRPGGINGMIRYNTSTNRLEGFENGQWGNISAATASASPPFPLLASPVGTAGAPAYSFTGDANTGMYDVGLGTLGFAAGGVNRMVIASSGLVGIGTMSPTSEVHVYAAGTSQVTIDAIGNVPALSAGNFLRRSRGSSGSPVAVQSGDIIGRIAAYGYRATGFSAATNGAIEFAADENFSDTTTGTRIDFYTTPNTTTTRANSVTFASNGRVGIGSGSPTQTLDVIGLAKAKGFVNETQSVSLNSVSTFAADGSGVILATQIAGANSISAIAGCDSGTVAQGQTVTIIAFVYTAGSTIFVDTAVATTAPDALTLSGSGNLTIASAANLGSSLTLMCTTIAGTKKWIEVSRSANTN